MRRCGTSRCRRSARCERNIADYRCFFMAGQATFRGQVVCESRVSAYVRRAWIPTPIRLREWEAADTDAERVDIGESVREGPVR
jgi:hypothetical protein